MNRWKSGREHAWWQVVGRGRTSDGWVKNTVGKGAMNVVGGGGDGRRERGSLALGEIWHLAAASQAQRASVGVRRSRTRPRLREAGE